MFSSTVIMSTLTLLAGLQLVAASPTFAPASTPITVNVNHKRANAAVTDTEILQYAAVLEDLEAEFYKEYLDKYSAAEGVTDERRLQYFKAVGYPGWVRARVQQIASHEAEHSTFLNTALGSSAPPKCKYTFPATSVDSFLALASVIESVGVSAYLGAAADITTPAYVTIAGSILTVEARHQGWLNAAVLKEAAWSAPYDTPLSYSPVYSIASAFISSCDGPLPLPFKAFPALTIDMATGALTYDNPSDGNHLAIYSGLDAKTFPISGGKVQLPTIQGFAYALVVSTDNITAVEDSNTVAGPFIIDLPFGSKVQNPSASF